MLPEMPQALIDIGGEYTIEFDSPITRAQRAEEGVAILRTLEAAGSVAQFDPSAIKVINGSEALRELAEINGVPAKILRSREEVDAQNQAEAQAAQLQQVLQAAPVIADTAQTLANTEQISRAAGQPTPGVSV
ncbi:Bacteriophage head to tail connecting protein [compost metagenome]